MASLKASGIRTLLLDWNDYFGDDPDLLTTRIRCVGDPQTWKIDLDTTGVGAGDKLSTDTLEVCTFKIFKPRTSSRYKMDAKPAFCNPILRHFYVTASDTRQQCVLRTVPVSMTLYVDKIPALAQELNKVTRIELLQVPEDEKTDELANHMADVNAGNVEPADFAWKDGEVPGSWSFFDDLLVRQLKKMWEEHVQQNGGGQYSVKRHGKK